MQSMYRIHLHGEDSVLFYMVHNVANCLCQIKNGPMVLHPFIYLRMMACEYLCFIMLLVKF
jgi:hypothetical protein